MDKDCLSLTMYAFFIHIVGLTSRISRAVDAGLHPRVISITLPAGGGLRSRVRSVTLPAGGYFPLWRWCHLRPASCRPAGTSSPRFGSLSLDPPTWASETSSSCSNSSVTSLPVGTLRDVALLIDMGLVDRFTPRIQHVNDNYRVPFLRRSSLWLYTT